MSHRAPERRAACTSHWCLVDRSLHGGARAVLLALLLELKRGYLAVECVAQLGARDVVPDQRRTRPRLISSRPEGLPIAAQP